MASIFLERWAEADILLYICFGRCTNGKSCEANRGSREKNVCMNLMRLARKL